MAADGWTPTPLHIPFIELLFPINVTEHRCSLCFEIWLTQYATESNLVCPIVASSRDIFDGIKHYRILLLETLMLSGIISYIYK